MVACGMQSVAKTALKRSDSVFTRSGSGRPGVSSARQNSWKLYSGKMTYTSYEGNSWAAHLHTSGAHVLTDPWLVGNLTFGGLDFIYSGKKKVTTPDSIDLDALINETDFILLTMSIDDHCHKPTLEAVKTRNSDIPIVASPSAAKVVKSIGFKNVYELDHGEQVSLLDGKVTVKASAGALVGPPWSKRENGYTIIEDGGLSVYYEPHADFTAESVKTLGTCDVVISPPCTQSLLGYDLVKGVTDNIPLLEILQPQAVIALMNAEFDGSGPLASLISETGGPKTLEQQLQESKNESLKKTRVVVPSAGAPCEVTIE